MVFDLVVHVLIADDKQLVLDSLSTLLSSMGYQVDNASNGLEALTKLMQGNYQLLITDHLMPIMSGIQLSKQARRTPELNDLKIILMTTQGASNLSQFQCDEYSDVVIDKPVDENFLLQIISSFKSKNTHLLSL